MEQLEKLLELNVNQFTEKVEGKPYLTWSQAWKEFLKVFPLATYEVKKSENGLPFFGDPAIGYMVYTTVTAGEVTREMWLPVLDSKFKTMKLEQYEYTTKYGTKSVAPMTMFDINKTVMRCLTKNLAMFGLGLYIYAGEDLPDPESDNGSRDKRSNQDVTIKQQILNRLSTLTEEQKQRYRNEIKSGCWDFDSSFLDHLISKYGAK